MQFAINRPAATCITTSAVGSKSFSAAAADLLGLDGAAVEESALGLFEGG